MATLIIDEGSANERRISLDPGAVTVGSGEADDVRFPEGQALVSPRHVSLRWEPTQWFVRDEGSAYGTFLNDRRVKEHGIGDGDVVELGLGGPRMRFVAGEGAGDADAQDQDDLATEVREAFRPEDHEAG